MINILSSTYSILASNTLRGHAPHDPWLMGVTSGDIINSFRISLPNAIPAILAILVLKCTNTYTCIAFIYDFNMLHPRAKLTVLVDLPS